MGVTDVVNNIDTNEEAVIASNTYNWDNLYYTSYTPVAYHNISYENELYLTDSELHDAVTDQLFWSPFVDSDDIFVSVQDGTVLLTGQVDSYREMNAAITNAWEADPINVESNLALED